MLISQYQSGTWQQQYQYRSFLPEMVNHPWDMEGTEIPAALDAAEASMQELNRVIEETEGIQSLTGGFIQQEAHSSCRLEGIETGLGNYPEVTLLINACEHAIGELGELPVSSRILKQAHWLMMQSEKGEKKNPGEFRKTQNWVGGKTLKEATYIPPVHEEVPALMSDLEKFIHNEYIGVHPLIRIAIAHYQFFLIQPFVDGNGRAGRLMTLLFLLEYGLIKSPVFPLSRYFEMYTGLYFNSMNRARTHNDLTLWLKVFLEAIRQTAETSCKTLKTTSN